MGPAFLEREWERERRVVLGFEESEFFFFFLGVKGKGMEWGLRLIRRAYMKDWPAIVGQELCTKENKAGISSCEWI